MPYANSGSGGRGKPYWTQKRQDKRRGPALRDDSDKLSVGNEEADRRRSSGLEVVGKLVLKSDQSNSRQDEL